MLRARLFGGLAVEIDGQALPDVPGLRPRALLAYLLMRPGPHPRARLAGVFWPDVLDTSARASLRSALWTVRGALDAIGGGAYLVGDRAGAGIAADLPRWIDAEEADALLAAGDRASLERAVALAAEPFLADMVDEWAMEAQDAWRERLVGALERLAELAEAQGDAGAAVEWTRRALRHDRLREASHRALMRRLAAAGERAQAMAAYRRCRDVLAAELGIPPSAETRALLEELRAGAPPPPSAPRPAAATAPAPPPAAARIPAGVPAAPPLRGRSAELEALTERLRAARDGAGGVVAIAGEAGIGKSRLARELLAQAASGGARTASGAAVDLEAGPPFGAWSEALRELVRACPAPPGETGWPADLALLCPAVESSWGRAAAAVAAPDLERLRVFEAVVEAIAWCARDGPVVVLLDDLHRADPATLALLGHVGRRVHEIPALLVLTRRPAAAGADLDRALDALRGREGALVEVELGPLEGDAVAAVVADAAPGLDGEEAARAVSAADGNPLLAREGARAAAAGLAPEEGLRALVRGALAGLSGPGRELVAVAAAAGRPLQPGETVELVGADAADEARAIASSGLLAWADEGHVGFGHDLVRRACYAELAAPWRAWAHGRLAEILAGRGAPVPAELARHLLLAGRARQAVPHLAAAAAEARRVGALDEAARFLNEGIELSGGSRDGAELWLELADVHAWRGDRAEMDAAFARARGLLEEAGDAGALAAAWTARGHWLRTSVCYPRESLDAYRTALDLLDGRVDEAPELELLALAGSAWAEAMAGDPARAEALIAQLEGHPEVGRDPGLAAELALDRATALIRAGRMAEAEELGARAAALAEATGRSDLAVVAWSNIASAAAARGDFARCLELVERAQCEELAGPVLAGHVLAARAHALSRLGRHAEAIEAARRQAAMAARFGGAVVEATAAFDLGCVLLRAGEPAGAAGRLGAALEGPDGQFSRPLARLLRAEALVGAGDVDAAAAELSRFPFEPVGPGDLPETLVGRLAHAQALVELARGEPERALRRLDEAEAAWRRRLAVAPEGDVFAAALTDLGRPPVAGLVEPALELGKALAERAGALAALGRPIEAAAAADEARALADATGWEGYRARLEGSAAAVTTPPGG
jgi:DNA-binding SARP family transcriptional activator